MRRGGRKTTYYWWVWGKAGNWNVSRLLQSVKENSNWGLYVLLQGNWGFRDRFCRTFQHDLAYSTHLHTSDGESILHRVAPMKRGLFGHVGTVLCNQLLLLFHVKKLNNSKAFSHHAIHSFFFQSDLHGLTTCITSNVWVHKCFFFLKISQLLTKMWWEHDLPVLPLLVLFPGAEPYYLLNFKVLRCEHAEKHFHTSWRWLNFNNHSGANSELTPGCQRLVHGLLFIFF